MQGKKYRMMLIRKEKTEIKTKVGVAGLTLMALKMNLTVVMGKKALTTQMKMSSKVGTISR